MTSFEDVRAYIATRHTLRDNEPFLLSFELKIGEGERRQGMYLAELEAEDGSKLLRISTPITRTARVNAERCLRFNWAQRVGFLAVSELDGHDWLHLCENRPYHALNDEELAKLVSEIGPLADRLERMLSGHDHA